MTGQGNQAPGDHPLRHALAEEMHARPSPVLPERAEALFLALRPLRRADRDRAAERAALVALARGWGQPEPPGAATQWTLGGGELHLTWESHAEFVSLLLWGPPGDEPIEHHLPAGWLAALPGLRIAAARFRVTPDEGGAVAAAMTLFRPESLAVARILDGSVTVAGDFRLGAEGKMRFAVLPRPGTDPARIGRVVQRLCEIETYRAMAMLGFARAQELGPVLSELEGRLAGRIAGLGTTESAADTLRELLDIAARVEAVGTRASFRFAATAAYEGIVLQRIRALREERYESRQTFAEFMSRRFDPAMRTVSATERRIAALTARAARAAELLRTRVEVEQSAQTAALLASMDRRSDQALRLQHTVEGLSVVAIAYYAVGLVLHVAEPLAEEYHLAGPLLPAVVTPVVALLTWIGLRWIRRRLQRR